MIDYDNFILKDYDGQAAIEVMDDSGNLVLLGVDMVEMLLERMKEVQ